MSALEKFFKLKSLEVENKSSSESGQSPLLEMSFAKLMTLSQLKAIGVKDERWTINDKLLMYKGLIRIYNREQKNQLKDTSGLKKKNYRKIASLQKEVRELHEYVALSTYGDKRVMRRLLQNHKELQLTYMNMSPDKVSEDLNHRIFCKKKQLNIIRYKRKSREEKLLHTQVAIGDLNYLINAPDFGRRDLQQQALTNAIQSYIVKFCAAMNIQSVYKRMLAVLYKDQRYYEAVLVTLQNDSKIQHKCLIRATEMGQMAMEEMANMRYEYTRLEKEVRTNMIERESCLKEIRDRLVDLYEESQGLVRTESEFDMQLIQGEVKKRGKNIEEEVAELDALLYKLQEVTLVPKFGDIFPRLLETLRQKRRLFEQLRVNAAACDDLLNKKNHAELMYYSFHHMGAEANEEYNFQVEKLKHQIDSQKERLANVLKEQAVVSKQSVELRAGLQRLVQILEGVKIPSDYVDEQVQPWPVKDVAVSLRPKIAATEEQEPERLPINEEALRLIHLLDSKMRYIKARLKEQGDLSEQERAFVAHYKHVSEKMATHLYPSEEVTEAHALIVDIVLEDPQVPNRTEIKARSHEIYTEATRNPFEVVEVKGKGKKSRKK